MMLYLILLIQGALTLLPPAPRAAPAPPDILIFMQQRLFESPRARLELV